MSIIMVYKLTFVWLAELGVVLIVGPSLACSVGLVGVIM